jgi:hypothetical protein
MNASKQTKAAYFDHIGSIELPVEIIKMCPLQGAADSAIAHMRTLPEVIKELEGIDPEKLKKELKEHGEWDENELSNHNDNLDRILWIACSDIQEGKHDETKQID